MSTGEAFWDDLERPTIEERFNRAKKIRNKMGIYGPGGQSSPDFYKISKVHTQGLMEWCFGLIWSDKTLDPKIKEVAVLASMVSQDFHNEIEWHVKSGLNLGLKREEIIALIVQCTPYCGYPKVNHALAAAMRAFKSVDEANGAKKKSTKGRKKRAARSN
jgi:4-carboxymuconolactone decarboxylase